ncbi:MAG: chaperone NapD [Coriobacteriales bacterium]|jgi:nitrate reductase NapD|nr:chaperone NapD [Coriobacteriales bacterium]
MNASRDLLEPTSLAEESVVISSVLVETKAASLKDVTTYLAQMPGVQVHSTHGTCLVVTIEAPTIDASYAIATELTAIDGVLNVQLVYANFEDDPGIKARMRADAKN